MEMEVSGNAEVDGDGDAQKRLRWMREHGRASELWRRGTECMGPEVQRNSGGAQ